MVLEVGLPPITGMMLIMRCQLRNLHWRGTDYATSRATNYWNDADYATSTVGVQIARPQGPPITGMMLITRPPLEGYRLRDLHSRATNYWNDADYATSTVGVQIARPQGPPITGMMLITRPPLEGYRLRDLHSRATNYWNDADYATSRATNHWNDADYVTSTGGVPLEQGMTFRATVIIIALTVPVIFAIVILVIPHRYLESLQLQPHVVVQISCLSLTFFLGLALPWWHFSQDSGTNTSQDSETSSQDPLT